MGNPSKPDFFSRSESRGDSAFLVSGVTGILGTCLEYCRRGYTLSLADVAGNLDDYVASPTGGRMVRGRAWPYARLFLVLAWALFQQLLGADPTHASRPESENTFIISAKLAKVPEQVHQQRYARAWGILRVLRERLWRPRGVRALKSTLQIPELPPYRRFQNWQKLRLTAET